MTFKPKPEPEQVFANNRMIQKRKRTTETGKPVPTSHPHLIAIKPQAINHLAPCDERNGSGEEVQSGFDKRSGLEEGFPRKFDRKKNRRSNRPKRSSFRMETGNPVDAHVFYEYIAS